MKKSLLSCTLFLFFSLTAKTQQEEQALHAFNNYYHKSIEKLRELYGMRGAMFICEAEGENKNYLSEVKDFISRYGDLSQMIGVLFYSHENDSLHTWLYHNDSLFYHVQHITQKELRDNEYSLRESLQVTRLISKRAVINLRSQIIDETPSATVAKPLDTAIKESTDILFPVSIRTHLGSISHLFIIPEYNIGQYPFHLLRPFNNNKYLVDKISFSFIPHLCNLGIFAQQYQFKLGEAQSLEAKYPLVVGNPAFSKNTAFRLLPLPGAESEAKAVANSLGTVALTGTAATVDTVAKLSKQSDLLYFATHGYFDFEKIMDGTFLAFAPGKNNTTGLWTSREIQNAQIKQQGDNDPKIAILSACQTGYGKVVPGGFIGLARAFYKSGVDFTVMSLWSVDDEKTKELMLLYLEELKKPAYFFPASPLKKAIIRFKKENPNPVYWAAFSVFGFTF